jgi:hypothetical protein
MKSYAKIFNNCLCFQDSISCGFIQICWKLRNSDTYEYIALYKCEHTSVYAYIKKVKAIPVTGHGGFYWCETLRLPHFLDNWQRDGCVLSALRTGRPLPSVKFLVLISVRD